MQEKLKSVLNWGSQVTWLLNGSSETWIFIEKMFLPNGVGVHGGNQLSPISKKMLMHMTFCSKNSCSTFNVKITQNFLRVAACFLKKITHAEFKYLFQLLFISVPTILSKILFNLTKNRKKWIHLFSRALVWNERTHKKKKKKKNQVVYRLHPNLTTIFYLNNFQIFSYFHSIRSIYGMMVIDIGNYPNEQSSNPG